MPYVNVPNDLITFRYEIPEYALKGDQGEMVFKPFVLNNLYTQVLST